LRTTLLSPGAFVAGKLLSALSYIFLLVLVSIPLQSIAFLLGGLSAVELILSQLLVVTAAVTYALYGLWCSAVMRSTLAATVATFAGMLFLVFGVPMLAFVVALGLGIPAGLSIVSGPLTEIVLVYLGLGLAATNLPAALITSEAFLLQQGTIFAFTEFVGGRSIVIVSPWLLFILLHAAAALVFYGAIVRRVGRVSDV
jgi:hypothetical protein